MNRISLMLIGLVLIGCTATEFRRLNSTSDEAIASVLSRVELKGEDNNVTIKDIEAYLHFKDLAYDKKAVSVEPKAEGEDTLLYIVNYDDGWEIVAGDKRAPILLAYSDSGSFSNETKNVEMLAWIESLASDVQSLKYMEDVSLCTEEQLSNMQNAKSFWAMISGNIEDLYPETRFPHDTLPTYPGTGHWELKNTYTTTELYDDFRLMQTQWSQDYPFYNEYCPYTTSPSDGTRAPAGCVPVAGAQMLYYLHDNLSVPVTAPDSATCTGCIGFNMYTQTVGGSSTTTWGNMLHNYPNDRGYYSAAVLIADVGKKVHVSYGNEGSGADEADLPDDVFAPYGIDCSFDDYNASTVSQSLLNGMPVIIGAYGKRTYNFWGQVSYSEGHCFVIDGCRRYRKHYTYCYEWEWDEWYGGHPIPNLGTHTVHSYGSPYITDFRMNWGWGGTDNDSYFAKSGNWEITMDDGTICNYIYDRTMIYGFSVSD